MPCFLIAKKSPSEEVSASNPNTRDVILACLDVRLWAWFGLGGGVEKGMVMNGRVLGGKCGLPSGLGVLWLRSDLYLGRRRGW